MATVVFHRKRRGSRGGRPVGLDAADYKNRNRQTASQATALRELTGPMTMKELAERMSCEPSNATFVADKLEALELIERRPHPNDRRAKQLVLTPRGAELRERLLAMLVRESPPAGLNQRERAVLHDLLDRAVAGGDRTTGLFADNP